MNQYLPNGTLLQGGRYKIIRFISCGGFGCTYEAIHTQLGKRFAIKEFFVKSYCNRDPNTSYISVGSTNMTALVEKLRKKFMNEARTLCKFDHPGIVRISDVFEEYGTAYFVMDYIEGESISDILKRQSTINESQAIDYILQVCDALEEVHKNNCLHLDIKPANIMINKNGKAILIDFGVSKQYEESNGENTSSLLGNTTGFAPLEQMSNKVRNFYPATDIYSVGATLYKMLCGLTPPSSIDIAANVETIPPLPQNISAATKNAVECAMKLQKENRPQNIDEFRKLLTGGSSQDTAISTSSKSEDATIISDCHTNIIKDKKATSNYIHPKNEVSPKSKKTTIIICAILVGLLSVMIPLTILHCLRHSNSDTDIVIEEIADLNADYSEPTDADPEEGQAPTEDINTSPPKLLTVYSVSCPHYRERQGNNHYLPSNLVDGNPATCWAVDLSNNAIYDYDQIWGPVFSFDNIKLSHIVIRNGYAKNMYTFKNNCRPSRLKLHNQDLTPSSHTVPAEYLYNGALIDSPAPQTIYVNQNLQSNRNINRIVMTMDTPSNGGIISGEKWNDLCISEIEFWGWQ